MDCNKTNCMECKFGGQSDRCHFDEKSYNQAIEDLLKKCGGGTYESDCELCTFAIFRDDIRIGCELSELIK